MVWAEQLGKTPAMLAKVTISKARSFHAGKTMVSPGQCTTTCCYFCPWACGCTNQMPIKGVVPVELEGTAVACCVVTGAPLGATDLKIAEEALTKAGFAQVEGIWKKAKGGAPPTGEEMAR